MLLSEILYIAKNLRPLNESLNSHLLSTIFRKFDTSSETLIPHKEVSWYCYADPAPTKLTLEMRYKDLFKEGKLTSELCDTVEGRQSVLKCTYIKKTPAIGGSYERTVKQNGFISRVYHKLTYEGYHLGLSDITDDLLIHINKEDAKKKIYKTGLLFWVGYDNELRAITLDNKILFYIEEKTSYSSWYEVNPNYNETTDFSNFDNSDSIDEFIDKAFKKIPTFNIVTGDKNLKDTLGANNIKALQNQIGIYEILVVNDEGMNKINISDKVKSREDYIRFLKALKNINEANRKRYKTQITVNKSEKNLSKIFNNLNKYMVTCLDTLTELQLLEIETLNNLNEKDFIIGEYGEHIDIDWYFSNKLKNVIPDTYIVLDVQRHNSSGRGYHKVPVFNIKTVGDLFLIDNIYIEYVMEHISNTLLKYNDYIKIKNDVKSSTDEVLIALNYLKYAYERVKNSKNSYTSIISTANRMLKQKNIDTKALLNNVRLFVFD